VACGGGEEGKAERPIVTGPAIERSLANRLATRSDAVATQLDRGDPCAAAEEAARLRADLTASISAIPDIYVEDLSSLVNEIQAQIPPCDRSEDEDDEQKGKKKGKKKKDERDGGEGDD
jgi:hypothetical protein